ncbi:protein-methionine-sulfoxide reductase catalytic subunit MsrP [Salinarimonas ramus]|uniref:Protein-methionine-sulfoxide reductase catalytic subunit MsrP n=1 Tax=Salinarimonas ramus TaxID=690164 RepID=A0A917V2T5_9HYPH|nr:protein-methionine-sulfoxide reductase catalytic subunit MsrP [Salinarimonas ramus]GGK24465.1 mononuclear molybdenum enzyme YedY [Salinarimonas ramus]
MLIKRPRGWELPESAATPESVWLSRRSLMAGGAGMIGAAALPRLAQAQESDPTADLYPAPQDPRFTLDRPVTEEAVASNYNNFYEFGSSKRVAAAAQRLETRPWSIVVDGMVEEERTIDIDELVRAMTLEERLYRLRCVEAWAMAVPWTGFPLADLVEMARPLSSARYLRFETFMNPDVASGQRQSWYPWPYVEGVTMEEATNELAFLVTGIYGKPLDEQFGAPIRLALPWKYGFKSIKSIVRVTFTDERPVSFWEELAAQEYGFWANVNPEVPHPRWSQATERMLGTDEERPTVIYNGYGEWVASLYEGMEGERLFM